MPRPNALAGFRFDPDSEDTYVDATFVALEIARLLREGEEAVVGEFLGSQEIADVAACLEEMESADALTTMRLMPLRDQAELLGYLRPSSQLEIATRLGRRELAQVVSAMSHDERADLFKRLDEDAQEAL